MATHLLPFLPWLLAVWGLTEVLCLARLWRTGRSVRVDWIGGLWALPGRYLHDVHDVVGRRPAAARMHMVAAGGLLGGSVLLALGVVPGLAMARPYWGVVALAFACALAGAVLVARRRVPVRPASLSGGRFLWLPLWLGLHETGVLLVAFAGVLRPELPLGGVGLALAALGGGFLVWRLRDAPLRHAVAGALGLALHPRPGRFGGGRDTGLRPLDLDAPLLGVGVPADFPWTTLVSFDACVQCGRCEEACPANAAGQRLNPKRLIQDLSAAMRPPGTAPAYAGSPHPGIATPGHGGAQAPVIGRDAMIHPDTLWACTTCRACVHECPMMIEHVDAVIALRRYQTLECGAPPEKAAPLLTALRQADDPGARPPAARTDFAAGLDLRVLGEGEATDLLLWLGEGAYDLRHGRTLRALVRLLQRAGIDFAVLGAEERDCGDLARRLGDEATFQRLARANIATLATRRFRRIVTADPHALQVLSNEYPDFGGNYTVLHHTALLEELVRAGRLVPVRPVAGRVTFHDPCYLARYNGGTEAPRAVLTRIVREPVEMARHGERAMCCGGGGGSPFADVPGARRIPDLRMQQARNVGAELVAVACPGCAAMLEGVTGARPEVRDIAELLLAAVEDTP
ncbi:Iron-sulfur cluster-binding protein [Rhodovastum atsumiense]|uniref:DUF3483 domain-containing protein n=1 Tax=Rhodovastum atsumiense TaxID=504468 RepID=A0A5M6J0J5_9PROT|nr:DUF3483 domain-containing protein [Rhodovastum atsumiense]KAA5614114.1 DUF3483 domain-containing protein [Rhodovastum atsumiense]CAH2598959.1 Iron-sulfur cluster-binding protein [Rhodovastum atsumiense]